MDQQRKKYREPKDTLWGKCLTTFIAIVFAMSTLTIIPIAGALDNPANEQADAAAAAAAKEAADEAEGKSGATLTEETPKPIETATTYATQAELDAAFEAVGEADDIDSTIAAIDNYLRIYSNLSPEDKAANAEGVEQAKAYRDTLRNVEQAEEGDEPGIQTMAYTTYKSTITFYPGDGIPTGTKMKVGDWYKGNWYVKSIDTSHVTFGSPYGEHNNSFYVPAPEDIWTGVSSSYKTVAKYSTAFNGDANIHSNPILIYTGGHATFANVINTGGNTGGNAGGNGGGGNTSPTSDVWNFTLYYDNNGGGTNYATQYWSGSKYTKSGSLNIHPNTPQREGYTFNGWKSKSNGNTYNPNTIYNFSFTNISGYNGGSKSDTLVAQWTKVSQNYSATVIYDANTTDSVSGMPSPNPQTLNWTANDEALAGNYNFNVSTNTPQRDGYEFMGWAYDPSTSPDAGWLIKPGNQTNAVRSGTVTLYAIWKATNPPTRTGNFPVIKNFSGLLDGTEGPQVSLTYKAWRTKDGNQVGDVETGTVALTKNTDGTYRGTINPTIWDFTGNDNDPDRSRYKNVIQIIEDTETAKVDGHTWKSFKSLYTADAFSFANTVTFTMDGATFEKNLSVKNTYEIDKVTVTWLKDDGTQIKQETIPEGADYNELYPDDPSTTGKWSAPETDENGNITIRWQEVAAIPEQNGTWQLDITKEISNYRNSGVDVTFDSLPKDFAVTVAVSYHNGTGRVTESRTLNKNDLTPSYWTEPWGQEGSLTWNKVFDLPDWQYDFAGTGKTAADFAEYNTVITITEANYDVSNYTCTMGALDETSSTAPDGATHKMDNGTYTVTYPVQQSGGSAHTQSRFGLRNSYEAIEHTVTVNHLGDNGHNFWTGWDPTYSLAEGQSYDHSFDENMTALAYPNNSNVRSPKSFSIGSDHHYVLDPMANNTPEDELAGTMGSEDVVINLYYSEDVKGTINPDGTETPDGIPDKYQATVTYEVENGTFAEGAATTQVVTFTKDGNYVVPGTEGATHTKLSVPASSANAGYGNGTWAVTAGNGTVTDNVPASVTGNATFTITYAPETYTISYELDGGIVNGTNPATYTVESDDITLINPTKVGYTFTGWTGTGLTGATTDVTIAKGSTGDRSYTATWRANGNTAYKVEHYQQNLDGTYSLVETENLTGATDSTVNATVKTYEGFTHNPNAAGTLLQSTIAGDGSTVLRVYYDRNTYGVTYDLNGGSVEEGVQTTFEGVKHGDATPTVPDPTRTGYAFDRWTPAVAETVTGNVTYIAQWTPLTFDIDVEVVNGTSDAGTVGTTVNYGGDVTYTFTPNAGYVLESVMVDGQLAALSANGTFTFNAVTRNHSIVVTYAPAPVEQPDDPANPDEPTPGPVTPPTNPDNPAGPTTPANPGGTTTPVAPDAGAAAAAATPAAVAAVEAIGDEGNPLAAVTVPEEELADDANAMAAFEDIHCWTHWLMLFGALVTIVYGLAVLYRRRHDVRDMDDFEGDIMDGSRRYSARQASDPAANGAFQAM